MRSTPEFDAAAHALAEVGWCVISGFLDERRTQSLVDECATMHDARLLQTARTGNARSTSSLRGDRTHWFVNADMSAPQQMFTNRIDQLRVALNRQLMMGLVDCESHYAVYRPGAIYARHLDCLRGSDARVVSAVFYLNANWRDEDGGALRLYLGDGSSRDIYPHAGNLLLFLSAGFEHEVLPASRDRMSIACWLRQQAFQP